MTAIQIHQLLLDPEPMSVQTLPVLRELTERYPAFEAGWILYLKNLKILKDPSFDRELINGAIRIHDRRKLYLFLNQKGTVLPQESPNELSDDPELLNLILPSEYNIEKIAGTTDGHEDAALLRNREDKKNSLIEKFLEAQPRMPLIKPEGQEAPMESQKPKEPETEDLVTETLASIYAQQGYYKKAIQIFEKLSLKYPEKSTYFAAQIEKIKSLMNN